MGIPEAMILHIRRTGVFPTSHEELTISELEFPFSKFGLNIKKDMHVLSRGAGTLQSVGCSHFLSEAEGTKEHDRFLSTASTGEKQGCSGHC